ncbi:MAG: hypothetical protein QW291_00130 [Thermofilaceae archaeon]
MTRYGSLARHLLRIVEECLRTAICVDLEDIFGAFNEVGYGKQLNFEIPDESKACLESAQRVKYLVGLINSLMRNIPI